eukprot:Phypoly_transcript_22265.p1 GENE.Phypoly_transcript_22265~~Phypoly_transcript_22265.p1  ORF type:complete len:167 (+),score=27.65 Phypoly_transcript_22265:98-598(+)
MPQESTIDLGDLTDKNVGQLKILNAAIFPVKYNDKFYTDLLLPGREELTKLAYYNDIFVGAVCCRVEEEHKVYIMTLGVLAPYRQLKIGTELLEYVINLCKKHPQVQQIYLHVQVNNDAAIEFYKRFGFEITETIQNYYKRIEPPDCYVLLKTLTKDPTAPNGTKK